MSSIKQLPGDEAINLFNSFSPMKQSEVKGKYGTSYSLSKTRMEKCLSGDIGMAEVWKLYTQSKMCHTSVDKCHDFWNWWKMKFFSQNDLHLNSQETANGITQVCSIHLTKPSIHESVKPEVIGVKIFLNSFWEIVTVRRISTGENNPSKASFGYAPLNSEDLDSINEFLNHRNVVS